MYVAIGERWAWKKVNIRVSDSGGDAGEKAA